MFRRHYASDPYKSKKPILRIKVEHTNYDAVRLKRLEGRFLDRVANPEYSIFRYH